MYSLLIADDEPKIRNGLCSYFPWNDIGFNIVGDVENGKQALEFVSCNHVDVILLDIEMPIISGIDLAKILHERKSNVKIVFLSAYKEFEYAQKALIYGVKNYIIKPSKYSELVQVFSAIREELDKETNATVKNKNKYILNENERSLCSNDKLIIIIKKYIQDNYNNVCLEDIANVVHLNFCYISRLFKKITGQTFSEYLATVKMGKASELLLNPNYKTYEVSKMVSYDNPKNFSKKFRQYYGITPKQFKESKYFTE